jgi:hypothetical protein
VDQRNSDEKINDESKDPGFALQPGQTIKICILKVTAAGSSDVVSAYHLGDWSYGS